MQMSRGTADLSWQIRNSSSFHCPLRASQKVWPSRHLQVFSESASSDQAGEESPIVIKRCRSLGFCVVCSVWSILEDSTGQWIVWLLLLLTFGIALPSFPPIFPCNQPHGNHIKFLGCLLCVWLSLACCSCGATALCPGSLLPSGTAHSHIFEPQNLHIVIVTYVTWHINKALYASGFTPLSLKQFVHNSGHSSDIVIPASPLGNAS